MKHANYTKHIKMRLALYPAIAILAYGAFAYFCNPATKTIQTRQDKAVNFLILTRPSIFISYNPKFKKAMVTNIEAAKKGLKVQDVLKGAGLKKDDVLFLNPKTQNRAEFWEMFKTGLHSWRVKPYIVLVYLFDYTKLRITGKTNIPVSDFIMMSLDLMQLTPADFSVQNPGKQPAARRRIMQPPPQQLSLAQNIRPASNAKKTIVVEILNASGKGGLASDVTRYLRDLNNRDILNIDVINYANHTTTEENTIILEHTGRLEDLKKVGYYLGLENKEIFSTVDNVAISDAKIILGKDFSLPKNIR